MRITCRSVEGIHAVGINMGGVKLGAGSVWTKVNESDDALVSFCLCLCQSVWVDLRSVFPENIPCSHPTGGMGDG